MASWERFVRSTPRDNEKERYSAVIFLRKKNGNDLHNFILEIFKKCGIMIKAGRHNISDQRRKQTERILIYDKRTEK